MRALCLLSSLLLAACGQSGDLYLPPAQPESAPAPAEAPAEGPAADKDKPKEPK